MIPHAIDFTATADAYMQLRIEAQPRTRAHISMCRHKHVRMHMSHSVLCQIFISYSWHAALVSLASAIRRRHPSAGDYFWIDIFNVAQLRHTEQAAEYNKSDVGRFAQAIEASNATVRLRCCNHAHVHDAMIRYGCTWSHGTTQ